MSRNDFDELLRKKMDEEELVYNPAHWEQLARRLPQAAPQQIPFRLRKRILWPIGIAAATLLAVGSVFLWFGQTEEHTVNPSYTEAHRPVENKTTPELKTPDSQSQHHLKPATYAGAPIIDHSLPSRPAPPSDVTPAPLINQNHNSNELPDHHGSSVTPEDFNATKSIATHRDRNSSLNPETTQDDYFNAYTLLQKHPEGRTSLAVGGGVNYGTFKTGVTFGISARQYLGNRMFVDGTVAMNINQGNDNTLHYTGNVMNDLLSGNGNTRSRPSGHFYPANDFYYIQVNPTIGYKLTKQFSLSAGPDVQQLLRDGSDNALMFLNDEVKMIPDLDVGMTGKAEFAITPNIQSGIIYREGLNNAVRNSNDFLNRRYIQVQMRYTVPLKK